MLQVNDNKHPAPNLFIYGMTSITPGFMTHTRYDVCTRLVSIHVPYNLAKYGMVDRLKHTTVFEPIQDSTDLFYE